MFKVDDIIGDVVFFSFKDNERLAQLGINSNTAHFLVKGYDHLGIWVEHPGLVFTYSEDKNGKPLPENKVKKESIDANFLITWDMINTIMHYPNREGFDFPSEFDRNIGFKKDSK